MLVRCVSSDILAITDWQQRTVNYAHVHTHVGGTLVEYSEFYYFFFLFEALHDLVSKVDPLYNIMLKNAKFV